MRGRGRGWRAGIIVEMWASLFLLLWQPKQSNLRGFLGMSAGPRLLLVVVVLALVWVLALVVVVVVGVVGVVLVLWLWLWLWLSLLQSGGDCEGGG